MNVDNSSAEGEFRRTAGSLTRSRLDALVARHAVRDRLLATDLQVAAEQLKAATRTELRPLRQLVNKARSIPEADYGWDLHDIVIAAREIVEELHVLAVRGPSQGLLEATEYAIAVWEELAALLSQDWRTYDAESEVICQDLADIHLDLCEQAPAAPLALAERLVRLDVASQLGTSCINAPDRYRHLLGPEGVSAFEELRGKRRCW